MGRRPVAHSTRLALAARYGATEPGYYAIGCHWCGTDVTFRIDPATDFCIQPTLKMWTATLDHLEPVFLGGTNDLENLVFACQPCNSSRGYLHATPPRLGVKHG